MPMPDLNEFRIAYGKAVARAWSDAAYKDQLLNDPRATLASAGIDIPSGVEISILEDSADKKHLVLPTPPAEGEIGDDNLAAASGGNNVSCCSGNAGCNSNNVY